MQKSLPGNVRFIAALALKDIYKKSGYSNLVLNSYFKKTSLSERDKAFATRCVYGVLQWQRLIDYYLEKISNRPLNKIKLNLLILLRLGLYQIIFLDRVPPRAAVYETVNVAQLMKEVKGAGFLNGVLRNYLRKKDEIEMPEDISIRYSHPDWMVKQWLNRFGEEVTIQLCKRNNSIPSTFLRVNTLNIDKASLLGKLEEKNISCESASYPCEAIKVKSLQGLNELDLFNKGYFYIQDINSMLVAHLASPSEGDKVIDLCSAPGGKTTHMAQLMQNKGEVIAVDIHTSRIKMVEENCKRLGVEIVRTWEGDARELLNVSEYDEYFDISLVDAPCSALGVLQKQPELKWRSNEKDIASLRELQKELMLAAIKATKPGGRIVFSTCTITAQENEDLIEELLMLIPAKIEVINPLDILPGHISSYAFKIYDQGLLFLPSHEGGDGFFMTSLIKKSG